RPGNHAAQRATEPGRTGLDVPAAGAVRTPPRVRGRVSGVRCRCVAQAGALGAVPAPGGGSAPDGRLRSAACGAAAAAHRGPGAGARSRPPTGGEYRLVARPVRGREPARRGTAHRTRGVAGEETGQVSTAHDVALRIDGLRLRQLGRALATGAAA